MRTLEDLKTALHNTLIKHLKKYLYEDDILEKNGMKAQMRIYNDSKNKEYCIKITFPYKD